MVLGAPFAHGHSVVLEECRAKGVFGLPSAEVGDCTDLLRRSAQQNLYALEADVVEFVHDRSPGGAQEVHLRKPAGT